MFCGDEKKFNNKNVVDFVSVCGASWCTWKKGRCTRRNLHERVFYKSASNKYCGKFLRNNGLKILIILFCRYIVKKKEGTENQLDFFLVALADPRGFIPKWVVNKGSTTAPPQWMASLRAACLDVMHDEAQVAYAVNYFKILVFFMNFKSPIQCFWIFWRYDFWKMFVIQMFLEWIRKADGYTRQW